MTNLHGAWVSCKICAKRATTGNLRRRNQAYLCDRRVVVSVRKPRKNRQNLSGSVPLQAGGIPGCQIRLTGGIPRVGGAEKNDFGPSGVEAVLKIVLLQLSYCGNASESGETKKARREHV